MVRPLHERQSGSGASPRPVRIAAPRARAESQPPKPGARGERPPSLSPNIAPPAPEGIGGISAITLVGVVGLATTFVTRPRIHLHFASNAVRVRLRQRLLRQITLPLPLSPELDAFEFLLASFECGTGRLPVRVPYRTADNREETAADGMGTRSRPRGTRLSNDAHGE
jgi:hypothetical protein